MSQQSSLIVINEMIIHVSPCLCPLLQASWVQETRQPKGITVCWTRSKLCVGPARTLRPSAATRYVSLCLARGPELPVSTCSHYLTTLRATAGATPPKVRITREFKQLFLEPLCGHSQYGGAAFIFTFFVCVLTWAFLCSGEAAFIIMLFSTGWTSYCQGQNNPEVKSVMAPKLDGISVGANGHILYSQLT